MMKTVIFLVGKLLNGKIFAKIIHFHTIILFLSYHELKRYAEFILVLYALITYIHTFNAWLLNLSLIFSQYLLQKDICNDLILSNKYITIPYMLYMT